MFTPCFQIQTFLRPLWMLGTLAAWLGASAFSTAAEAKRHPGEVIYMQQCAQVGAITCFG
jgi:hypothetical protein